MIGAQGQLPSEGRGNYLDSDESDDEDLKPAVLFATMEYMSTSLILKKVVAAFLINHFMKVRVSGYYSHTRL